MAKLNGKGPENNGSGTGRKLGKCCNNSELNFNLYKLGQGMGRRRNAGNIEQKKENN